MLDIQNFRRFWSIRKSSFGPEGNHGFMTGEVVPTLNNYQHRMSISAESINFFIIIHVRICSSRGYFLIKVDFQGTVG